MDSEPRPITHVEFLPVTTTPRMWPTAHYESSTASIDVVVLPLCPDLLRYEQIGAADNWRGRVVRAFFWLMRAWPT